MLSLINRYTCRWRACMFWLRRHRSSESISRHMTPRPEPKDMSWRESYSLWASPHLSHHLLLSIQIRKSPCKKKSNQMRPNQPFLLWYSIRAVPWIKTIEEIGTLLFVNRALNRLFTNANNLIKIIGDSALPKGTLAWIWNDTLSTWWQRTSGILKQECQN